jgi:hypothetical protein
MFRNVSLTSPWCFHNMPSLSSSLQQKWHPLGSFLILLNTPCCIPSVAQCPSASHDIAWHPHHPLMSFQHTHHLKKNLMSSMFSWHYSMSLNISLALLEILIMPWHLLDILCHLNKSNKIISTFLDISLSLPSLSIVLLSSSSSAKPVHVISQT